MSQRWTRVWGVLCIPALALAWGLDAQPMGEHSHGMATASLSQPKAPIRVTMEELHQHGGVPPGWKFSLPEGDPAAGRAVFAKLECYQCHAIQGESFPQTSTPGGQTGPDLTGMGDHHPAEYFTETIINPNAVIVTGPGYTDASGMSIMPDYRGTLTVVELTDLVAYLTSLKGEHAHAQAMGPMQHPGHESLLDKVVGEYHIRLVYHQAMAGGPEEGMQGMPGMHSHAGQGHAGQGSGMAPMSPQNHLMAFITDASTGEPVPYLPVTATITAGKRAPRTVKLMPMMGNTGFHYGANVTLPSQPSKVTLSVGATTMRLMPGVASKFSQAQQVSLDWSPGQTGDSGSGEHSFQHGGHGMPERAKGQ
jgi:uncharacterized protein involved in high-affinity Fe2+ transport